MIKKLLGYLEGNDNVITNLTVGKNYELVHGRTTFKGDNGNRREISNFRWAMPDSIKIAVCDGSLDEPKVPLQHMYCKYSKAVVCYTNQHHCTNCIDNPTHKPSDNATNGGYAPVNQEGTMMHSMAEPGMTFVPEDMPLVTGETFLRKPENSGGSCSYYDLHIEELGTVSCQDIIDGLKMTFNEGTVFKSTWRKAAARQGKLKANNTALRDAEKIHHSATRILEAERNAS